MDDLGVTYRQFRNLCLYLKQPVQCEFSLSKRPLGFESFSGSKCLLGLNAFAKIVRKERS